MLGIASPTGRRYPTTILKHEDIPWSKLTTGRYCCLTWDTDVEYDLMVATVTRSCETQQMRDYVLRKRGQGWVTIGEAGGTDWCDKRVNAFRTYSDSGTIAPYESHKVSEFLQIIRENR